MATQEELRAQFEGRSSTPSQEELKARFGSQPTGPPPEPEMMENSHTPTPEPQSMEEMLATGRDDTSLKQLAHGFMSPVYGASKLVTKGVEAATGRKSPFFSDELMRRREADYKTDVPEGRSDVIEGMGTAMNPTTWLGPKKVQVAGRVLKGGVEALAKHTGTNALQAMAMPVDPDKDYWKTQQGRAAGAAIIGNALAGGGALLGSTQKFLQSYISDAPGQATRYLKDMFGADAPEVARQLDALSSKVPGEKPTVGWLSTLEGGRWPEMAAIEKEARATKSIGGKFNQRDKVNTDAQLALMDTFIEPGKHPLGVGESNFGRELKSPIELKADKLAKPYYNDATQQMMYVPEKLKRSMVGPENLKAIKEGEDLITQSQLNYEAGLTDHIPGPPPIKGSEVNGFPEGPGIPGQPVEWNPQGWRNEGMEGFDQRQLFESHPEANRNILPMESIGSLQSQRQMMDHEIRLKSKDVNNSKAQLEALRMRPVRSGLTDRMRKASPEFDIAEEIWRQEMAPQNRADYVSALRNKFDSPEGPDQISFLKALRNPEKTASGAGIPFQVDSTEQLMGQGVAGARRMEQINALKAAAERDLALRAIYAPEKIKGNTEDIGQLVKKTTPPYLSVTATSGKGLAALIGRKMTEGRRGVISEAALNPNEMAKLLRATNPEDILKKIDPKTGEEKAMILNILRAISERGNEAGVRPVTGVLRSEMSREYGGPN